MSDQTLPVQFREGYTAPAGTKCPYYTTSDSGEAWLLGQYAAAHGMSPDCQCHKSRGYKWFLNCQTYRVDFGEVRLVALPAIKIHAPAYLSV